MNGNPMTEQVARLVGNLLAGDGEVFLPGVGSLFTERRGARRLSKRRVAPPCRMVSFSSQQRGAPLAEHIARMAECDTAAAQEIYDRWLSCVRVDDTLVVEGVGTLRFKNFTLDEAFDKRLNPQGHAPVRIHSISRFDWALWCGIAAILVALVAGGYQFLMLYPDNAEEEQTVAAETSAMAEIPAVQADTLAAAQAAATQTSAAQDPGAQASGAEAIGAATSVAQTSVAQTSAAQGPGADTAETQASLPETPAAQMETAAGTPALPASLVSGRKYVVLGVFSTPENAARAIREAVAEAPSLRCGVYRFGDKFLVSPFVSDDSAACALFIRSQSGNFPDMWTYTAR